MNESFPERGAVFWPVGTGDSSTIVVDEEVVLQIDLHDLAKADEDDTPEVPVVDRLVEALPLVNGVPYLAVFALTHADKDHCLGFADLLSKVTIGELWATPRLWREYNDDDGDSLCDDARAFQQEAERRVLATKAASNAGTVPISGNRILVIGYDSEHSTHAYDELADEYLSGPGHSVTVLDGHDCTGKFEAFFHAPFAADAAEARNETSLAMQVTLTHESGYTGKLLLFGDLAHDTIMKIFSYSEANDRQRYVAWDLLLAPHHCSKKVMYLRNTQGEEILQTDVLDALERHQIPGGVIISSSAVFPDVDVVGANPPHRMAADRYMEIADEVINTMSWLDVNEPSPVVFGVTEQGAAIVRDETVELVAHEAFAKSDTYAARSRLGRIVAAATLVAQSVASARTIEPSPTGPDRIQQAVTTDRGGESAPQTAVGFGR
jgi:beta-lactamase superfamily II metal-dependent hydrolase